jgi:hypothetical protein
MPNRTNITLLRGFSGASLPCLACATYASLPVYLTSCPPDRVGDFHELISVINKIDYARWHAYEVIVGKETLDPNLSVGPQSFRSHATLIHSPITSAVCLSVFLAAPCPLPSASATGRWYVN